MTIFPAPRFTAAALSRALGLPHDPTAEQAAIIEAPLESMLVIAGAGSGKTETMAARVVWLVANEFVAPEEVLGLTFTRKAAGELAERITSRLRTLSRLNGRRPGVDSEGAQLLEGTATVATYHSYAGQLVGEYGLRLGIEPDSRLLSEAACWQYAAEAVARYDGDLTEMTQAERTAVAAVVDLAGEMAEHLLTTADVGAELDRVLAAITATPSTGRGGLPEGLKSMAKALTNRRALLPIVDRFAELKRSRDALDFTDQIASAAALAARHPDIGAAQRRRYRVVLLDEFQDTSEAQLVLLRDLFVAAGDAVPVTAVGDPHQSIYGWRGASATTLARFPAEFRTGHRPVPVVPLSTSWRNDRVILAIANSLSDPLRAGSHVAVPSLVARPKAGPGAVTVARLDTQDDEATYLAAWIAASRTTADVSAAVLCRKRSQFAPVMAALEAADVPYEVVGLGGLLLTPEIVDLLAALRVVADPTRGDALMRLLSGAACRMGIADLDAFYVWAQERQRQHRRQESGTLGFALPGADSGEPDPGLLDPDDAGPRLVQLPDLAAESQDVVSLAEALEELPPHGWVGPAGQRLAPVVLERLRWLGGALRHVRAHAGMPLAELVGEAERALGLDIEVLARPGYTAAAARAHLDAFTEVAAQFAASADRPTLDGFLAWLEAAEKEERGLERGTLEPTPGAVQILTVHAAKGLEWDVVAIPGLVAGTFPARDGGVSSTPISGAAPEDGWAVAEPNAAGWTVGASGVPYRLRGDRDGLPVFDVDGAIDLADLERRRVDFRAREGARGLLEERRLAYVATTRARSRLLLTAHVWGTQASPRVTSPFLREVLTAAGITSGGEVPLGPAAGGGGVTVDVTRWDPMPDPHAPVVNPVTATPVEVLWPVDPFRERRKSLERSLARVRTEVDRLQHEAHPDAAASWPVAALVAPRTGTSLDPYAVDATLLLAETSAAQVAQPVEVEIPAHLSASDVVALAADPGRFAALRRRPVPTPPARAARRGTAFHAWVEQHFRNAALVDIDELPGCTDDDPAQDDALPQLQHAFLASEWAARVPVEVEIAVETVVDDLAIRGRIDAVFARPDGGFTIVDWKTGAPPGPEESRVRALQLGAYALAYARLRGLPVIKVDGAFFYAATGDTVYPELPSESELVEVLRAIPG